MSEHDRLTEAREALADTVEMACAGNALAARCWVEQYGLVILAALDGHAAALSAARREGAAEAFEEAAMTVEAEWYGVEHIAARIRALAEREVRT